MRKTLALIVTSSALVFLAAKHVWPTNLPRSWQGSNVVNTFCNDQGDVCVRVLRQWAGGRGKSVHTTLSFGGSAWHRWDHPMRIIQFQSDSFPDASIHGEDLVVSMGGMTMADELILTKDRSDLPLNVVFDTAN